MRPALPLLLLGVLILREYYAVTRSARLTYTVLALIILAQLTVWHSTTPLLLPISLAIVSVTPIAVHLVNRKHGSWRPNVNLLRFARSFPNVRLVERKFDVDVDWLTGRVAILD